MERDFLGLGAIGMAKGGGDGEAAAEESRTDPDNPPATLQWQFPANSATAPAFMSFSTAREEGSKEFSISGFRPPADGVSKQTSLPVMPQQRQFGFNNQVTAQQYPATSHGQYSPAAHHHLHGGSRMVQPLSVRHPVPFNQANPMLLRSQSFHNGTGGPFKNQPFTMSNGFGGSTVGAYGARNPRGQTSTQLTIFYNGSVNVFDNVPVEKAKELMMLASRASVSKPPPDASHKPDSPISSPAKVNVPEVLPARQIVVQKLEPLVPHLSNASSHCPIVSQAVTLSRSTSNCTTESTGPKPAFQPPVVAPTSQASSSQPMPLATTSAAASMPRAVPQARKASLARFLEKRKERVTSVEPYSTSKSPLESNDTIGSASAPSKSSSTDVASAGKYGEEPLRFGQPRNISFSSEVCPNTKLEI